ncbi:MAG TPA: clan AA aspartic protease [Saprospiraceae bacterium]|nr:clan AA aspartic protease [Saprospiraceae bacterium]
MGLIYAEIELINAEDIGLARKNYIDQDEIKKISIDMLVDTGAYNLCINEEIQVQLQLPFIEKRSAFTADNRLIEMDVVGPVIVKFKNRTTSCLAMVLPGNSDPLLGAIPLEDMDVLIHPLRQELIVNPDHPYMSVMTLK